MKTHKKAILMMIGVLFVGSFYFLRFSRPTPTPLKELFHEVQSPPKSQEEQYIYVDIRGEVLRPGVYKMLEDDRVFHLILRAGGLTDNAYTLTLNQAQKLRDGEAYTIMHHDQAAASAPHEPLPSEPKRININTADEALFSTLPGIGAATAKNIVAYRDEHGPFDSIEALLNVRNVGPATLEAIRDFITH